MSTRCYDTDLNDAAWAWIAPYLPAARSGGRPRTTDLRAVLNAIFYLLRTGLPVAPATPRVPAPGHRLPLLSCLALRSEKRRESNQKQCQETLVFRVAPFLGS